MPSLKELRTRIASVKSTQKITKAMQMVAAAKLRKAQEAALAARPYAERMENVIARLGKALEGRADAPQLAAGTGQDDVHLLIVATAERGLCGGFNSSIAKLARSHALKLQANGKQVKMICIGQKGYYILKGMFGGQIIETIFISSGKDAGFSTAKTTGKKLLEMLDRKEFDICTLFYAEFKSVMSQIPVAHQLIPALIPEVEGNEEKSVIPYEFEPDEDEILERLLPRNINVQIFRAILENAASEQGARMSAMDSATRNAGDMIGKLTLQYNRARQAIITKELIEIISGAEAL